MEEKWSGCVLSPKMHAAVLLMFGALSLAATGCRTFNYTESDMEKERKLLAENSAAAGFGGGMGGVSGFNPGVGKIGCGSMRVGGVGCGRSGK